jgi:hypothetical protein
VFPDVPLEIEDVGLRRLIVAQSDFLSALNTHHILNQVSAGTLPC